nr:hypothetical protein [Tanacetum cinerariifolium]
AYRVFNKRTRVIMESIHVNFDELPQMASAQNSSDPAPTCKKMASVQISSDPAPGCQTMALEHDSLSPGRANRSGAHATRAAPGIKSIWNTTCRVRGRPGCKPHNLLWFGSYDRNSGLSFFLNADKLR